VEVRPAAHHANTRTTVHDGVAPLGGCEHRIEVSQIPMYLCDANIVRKADRATLQTDHVVPAARKRGCDTSHQCATRTGDQYPHRDEPDRRRAIEPASAVRSIFAL